MYIKKKYIIIIIVSINYLFYNSWGRLLEIFWSFRRFKFSTSEFQERSERMRRE